MVGVTPAVVPVKGDSQKAKKAAVAAKVVKAKPAHPPTSEMVTTAIGELKERGGSSLSAIKKYLAGNYEVDVDRLAPFIKKFLRNAVLSGVLVQTKGKGAAGSFKLPKTSEKPKPKPKPKPKSPEAKKKPAAPKKEAKKVEEQPADSKKPTPASPKKVEKKKAAAKVVKKSAVAAKTPTKKAAKSAKATLNSPKVAKSKPNPPAAKKGAAKKAAKK